MTLLLTLKPHIVSMLLIVIQYYGMNIDSKTHNIIIYYYVDTGQQRLKCSIHYKVNNEPIYYYDHISEIIVTFSLPSIPLLTVAI